MKARGASKFWMNWRSRGVLEVAFAEMKFLGASMFVNWQCITPKERAPNLPDFLQRHVFFAALLSAFAGGGLDLVVPASKGLSVVQGLLQLDELAFAVASKSISLVGVWHLRGLSSSSR
ncbi:hypothetical protein MTO96_018114 [Rhipicephalus appendiculatus]